MNVRTGILIFAGLLLAKTSEAQLFGKKLGELGPVTTKQDSAVGASSYADILKDAEVHEGMFKIFKKKQKVYFEIPQNWELVTDFCNLLKSVDIPAPFVYNT